MPNLCTLATTKRRLMAIHRINLWSSPRNISTALMYSFRQRPDTTVVDEPLYAHYLSLSQNQHRHPGSEVVLSTQSSDGEQVLRNCILGSFPTPIVLFKQMTHHLTGLSRDFLSSTSNVLLIRDPRRIIASYSRVIPDPSIHDVGVQLQYELFLELRARGVLSAVLDTREVLHNPEAVLSQLCHKLKIPFFPEMLHWPAGPKPEDGSWAPHWYQGVHRSEGFQPYIEETIELTPAQEELASRCLPFYQRLSEESIKA